MRDRIPRVPQGRIAAAALVLGAAFSLQGAAYSYRNGANNYSGARDASINTQYAQYNGGNGTQTAGGAQLGCFTTTGSDAYTMRYLLKFGDLGIPAGTHVASAVLTLSVESWNAGPTDISGYYVKSEWSAASNRLGWINRGDTAAWASPGASGVGTDRIPGKSFALAPLTPVGAQTVKINLDAAVVQSWVNNAAANQGVLLVNNKPGEIVRVNSTAAGQNLRPMLTIVTAGPTPVGPVSVTPRIAAISPGRQQQFQATVSGASDTAVDWTATGGTITSGGLYTAGPTGNFQVKATLRSDPSKAGTATVSVRPEAPPRIQVAPASAIVLPGQTRQFTASLDGVASGAVTWSATGGTITPGGLFTAGAAQGSFRVTARGIADPTLSASAAVTVAAGGVVAVTPTSAILAPGQGLQFTATVGGTANAPVVWTATGGSITPAGWYTAGTAAGSFMVKATSAIDPTQSASSAVTIGSAVSVQVTPASAALLPGQTQQFNATVTGSTNMAVTWTATGGTITPAGLFTAGSTTGAFAVRATAAADSSKSGSAGVTINPAVSVQVSPASATLQPGQTRQFSAAVTGSANTAVTWTSTGGTITTDGRYTAGQTSGNFSVTARAVADSSRSAAASVSIQTPAPAVPRQSDGAFVVVQSPVSGMRFTAPATVRIFADPYVINAPDPDGHTVRFLLNGQAIGTYTGSASQNGLFPFTATNLTAGTYVVTAQIDTAQFGTVTSAPVTIYVENAPAPLGPVYDLTSDVVLTGAQVASFAGTAAARCRIAGNGYQIRTAAGFSGSLTIANCDVRGLGTASKPAIDVTANGSGSIQLTGNVFDTSGAVNVGANDQAQAVVRGNEFRENTVVPVGTQPATTSTATIAVFSATGNSTATKFFQGNNVGLSTVWFRNTRNWLIGGAVDGESNVLMGVRCGITVTQSTGMVLRGNYSQHNYPHRFSQALNFELLGDGFLVEHNVIRGSSWPVRGMGGEFRYNLVDEGGNSHAAVQSPMSNARFHHNVFLYSINQTLYAPDAAVNLRYNVDGVEFANNVFDGGGSGMAFYGSPVAVSAGSFLGSLRNNVFFNFAMLAGGPAVAGDLGEALNPAPARLRYADYNAFYNPLAPNQTNYGLSVVGKTPGSAGYGLRDAGGFNGKADPKFALGTAIPFPFAAEAVWTRTAKVSEILASFRARYTPAAGSPLIGAGDPQDGAGGNIGAVGNGEAADRFGIFGGGPATPALPAITSFTASNATINAGQSVTLNWSVSGADAVSLAPAPGAVTGTSVTLAPSTTTTYLLTAVNAGGFSTAPVTVTVTGGVPVTVSVAPTSAALTPGQTRQFTATVGGTANTAVTWTATGGTITASGLYTAGAATGSYSVTAASVQDSSKSASASVSIAPPQAIQVTVAPAGAIVYPNGAQQFTATVTNAASTAVTWTATGGSISASGLYTAGAATGSFSVTATSVQDPSRSGSAAVTVAAQTTTPHPRMILDATTLAALRAKMQANTAEWTRLKTRCDSYLGGGTIYPPGQNGYPSRPSVGEGYQGSGYFDALLPLGLCYQTTLAPDPARAAQYGAKAAAILGVMSDPANSIVNGQPVWRRDYGYGIRNFGVAMALGYDWFHAALTPALRAQIEASLGNWFTSFENESFEYGHPQGNYYAGYYAAKCFAGLAVQGDSPAGDGWWTSWYNNEHLQRVVPYYAANMGGGGWTEGFSQYGVLASRNQVLPVLAVKTAKGMDLVNAAQAYPFPIDQARYLLHFTWPARDMMDDRGELYNTESVTVWPGTPPVETYRFFAGFLRMWGDPLAPAMQRYARDVKTALDGLGVGGTPEWIDFLFWDPNAPEADYTGLPLSYVAPGVGGVSARSDWTGGATYLSFFSAPYINFPAAGHEPFDKGSVAIQRDKRPLLVNPPAWLSHEPYGSPGWTVTFDDRFGNWSADRSKGNRILYNTFQVRRLDAGGVPQDVYGQWAMQREDGARTRVARHEDAGAYVLTAGQFLEDMYRPLNSTCPGGSPVTSWSRQLLYLRPSRLIVYDRTGVCSTALDQYLAFHFAGPPAEVGGQASGVRRFDVNAGLFAGAMTVVLPANAATVTTDRFSTNSVTWNKVWRTEIRPGGPPVAARQWLTVFDLATSTTAVATAIPITVASGAATGTVLQAAEGNTAAVFGTAPLGTAISGTLIYSVPAAETRHIVTDLTPGAGYSVSVTVSGASHLVTVAPGGARTASVNGVLSFQVAAGGAVQP